jgi:hypothetical protein
VKTLKLTFSKQMGLVFLLTGNTGIFSRTEKILGRSFLQLHVASISVAFNVICRSKLALFIHAFFTTGRMQKMRAAAKHALVRILHSLLDWEVGLVMASGARQPTEGSSSTYGGDHPSLHHSMVPRHESHDPVHYITPLITLP